MGYSIQRHFSNSTVLLTGASGYVGILCLEKLLRTTDVAQVYVLLRPKRNEDIAARLKKMLHESSVMHLLRGNPVLDKVVPIAGNMLATDLGISLEDRRRLQQEVDTVIHCAADIRLEAGIKDLLQANYEGTRQLLKLCCSFNHLTSFVHVSSAYVNMNAPKGSLVKEAIYPLHYGDQLVDDFELVQELLSLPSHTANSRTEGLMKAWNFPNNYTLSKHLTEYMVADYHKHCKLPICIVRPTLISSVARDPYPGYTGNYAGHVGATLAFMAGLFNSPGASNYKGGNVWDVIPADVVVADILAAASAVGLGVAGSCVVTKTDHGRLPSSLPTSSKSNNNKSSSNHSKPARSSGANAINMQAFSRTVEQQQQDERQLLIVHSGSSTLYPLTIMESWNWGVEASGAWAPFWKLCTKCSSPLTADHEPDPKKAAALVYWTGWKVWGVSMLLRWLGEEKVAKKLTVGFESFKVINQPKTDVNLRFSACNMQKLASKLDPSEREDFLLLWKPVASSIRTAVATAAGAVGAALVPGAAPRYSFQAAAVECKAGSVATGLDADLAGLALDDVQGSDQGSVIKAGQLLSVSSSGSCSTTSSRRGSSMLSDSDGPASGSSSDVEHVSSDAEDSGDVSSDQQQSGSQPKHPGAKLGPAQLKELAHMKSVPICWRDFHVNLGAFLYVTLFRMPVPAQLQPITDEQTLSWLKIKPEEAWVRHQFRYYK